MTLPQLTDQDVQDYRAAWADTMDNQPLDLKQPGESDEEWEAAELAEFRLGLEQAAPIVLRRFAATLRRRFASIPADDWNLWPRSSVDEELAVELLEWTNG